MTVKNHQLHIPVLLEEVINLMDPKQNESLLDLTAGYGGHSRAIWQITKGPLTLVDRDEMAINHLKDLYRDEQAEILRSDFLTASQNLSSQKRSFDLILADLGLSSVHLNIASRGFSIMQDGPLDMRMDNTQDLTAEQIVNSYSAEELVRILTVYGEETRARDIVKNIVEARPIRTTSQLADVVKRSYRGHHKVHPATKTFQAIRIAVNDEIAQLEQSIPIWVEMLKPGGRLGIISFHSLEDRIVKQQFRELSENRYEAKLKLITRSPVLAEKNEIVSNPRSRSAKLRVAVKIKTERGTHAYPG